MLVAITREVSASIGRCELTHVPRAAIDVDVARAQHRRYEESLAALGCEVQRLPADPELPDSVFVEDTAVVLDKVAVITRPGAASRRPETQAVAEALKPYRRLSYIEAPGTVDGGDVLRVGRTLFVGISGRSNRAGVAQMRALLAPFGYAVREVPVSGCLHLKSAVTQVAEDALLVNRAWVDARPFEHLRLVDVDPAEPLGANALLVGGVVVYPAAYPRTRERLEARGIACRIVDVSELAKAEGAVTCCSLILSDGAFAQ
jgi:dimethylargininase